MKSVRSLSLVAALAAAMHGCVVGPDYVRPEVAVPAEWASPLGRGEQQGAPVQTAWWNELGDPVLIDLVARAAEANFDVRLAESRIREARAASTFAASVLRPGLRGNASALRRSATANFNGAPSQFEFPTSLFQIGFDASWEIDLFGGNRREIEVVEADRQAAEATHRDVLVSLASEVALNYIELRSAQQRLDITRRTIAAQKETVKLTAARYEAGLNSELDAVRAQALLATFEAQVPRLEQEMAGAIHRLGVLLGGAPDLVAEEMAAHAPLPKLPDAVMVGLPSELIARRPDIRVAERQLAAASARVGVAHAELFPKFYLTGGLSSETPSLGSLPSHQNRTWSVGPRVEWPVLQGQRLKANIEVQDARYEQAMIRYEQTIMRALEEVENALVGYANEQDLRDSVAQAVSANARAVTLANERYTRGLEDFLSVLQAQRELFDTEDRLVQSERQALMNLVSLYKALGGGWETPQEATDVAEAQLTETGELSPIPE